MRTCIYCGAENTETKCCQSCGKAFPIGFKKDEYTEKYITSAGLKEKEKFNEETEFRCPECKTVNKKEAPYCKKCYIKFRNLKQTVYDEKKLSELNAFVTLQKGNQKRMTLIVSSIIAVILLAGSLFIYKMLQSMEINEYISTGIHETNNGLEILGRKDRGAETYFDNSIEAFAQALEKDQYLSEVHFYTGVVYYYKFLNEKYMDDSDSEKMNSFLAKMSDHLKNALEIRKIYPEARVYLATYHCMKEDYEKALSEYEKVIAIKNTLKSKSRGKWINFAEKAKEKIENEDYSDFQPPRVMKY